MCGVNSAFARPILAKKKFQKSSQKFSKTLKIFSYQLVTGSYHFVASLCDQLWCAFNIWDPSVGLLWSSQRPIRMLNVSMAKHSALTFDEKFEYFSQKLTFDIWFSSKSRTGSTIQKLPLPKPSWRKMRLTFCPELELTSINHRP